MILLVVRRARGFLGEAGIRGLGAFGVDFAIPPQVFRLMAETELDQITEWGFLGGYLLPQALVFTTGATLGRLLFGMPDLEQALADNFSTDAIKVLEIQLGRP